PGRHLHVRHISVPHRLAIAEISDRLAVFDHIRDDVEFGVTLEKRLAIGIGPRRVELTKILAEGDQLRIGEFLIVEDDDQPLAPYVLNSLDLFWRDGLRQIEPGNFCAQRRVEVFDRKRHDYSSVETTSLTFRNGTCVTSIPIVELSSMHAR